MSILKLLTNDGFLTVNKSVARKVGLEAAALLAHLASVKLYHEEEEFFQTYEDIEEATTLPRKRAEKAIKKLVEVDVVSVQKKGVPAKNYYKIYEEKIADLVNVGRTCTDEMAVLERPKWPYRNGRNGRTINKNTGNKNTGNNKKKKKINKKKYGVYGNVKLTDEEYRKLKERLSGLVDRWIKTLDEGIELKGYKYKSHYLAVIKWAEREEKYDNSGQLSVKEHNRRIQEAFLAQDDGDGKEPDE